MFFRLKIILVVLFTNRSILLITVLFSPASKELQYSNLDIISAFDRIIAVCLVSMVLVFLNYIYERKKFVSFY